MANNNAPTLDMDDYAQAPTLDMSDFADNSDTSSQDTSSDDDSQDTSWVQDASDALSHLAEEQWVPHSLYGALKESGRTTADIANSLANLPSNAINMVQAGMAGIPATLGDVSDTVLGKNNAASKWLHRQAYYTPVAPTADLAKTVGVDAPHTLLGQMVSGGVQMAAMPEMEGLKAGEGAGLIKKFLAKQGQHAVAGVIPSAQAAAEAQKSGKSGMESFLENEAGAVLTGNVMEGVGKGVKVAKAIKNADKLQGEYSLTPEGKEQLEREKAHVEKGTANGANTPLMNAMNTMDYMQGDTNIRFSPDMLNAEVASEDGLIPLKRWLKHDLESGAVGKIKKASNLYSTPGVDEAVDKARASTHARELEAKAPAKWNDISDISADNTRKVEQFMKELNMREGENPVYSTEEKANREALGRFAAAQKELSNFMGRGVRAIDVGPSGVKSNLKLARTAQEMYDRLPAHYKAALGQMHNLEGEGYNPVNDYIQRLNTEALATAEQPTVGRKTTQATEGQKEGGGTFGDVMHTIATKGTNLLGKINPMERGRAKQLAPLMEQQRNFVSSIAQGRQSLMEKAAQAAKSVEDEDMPVQEIPEEAEQAVEEAKKYFDVSRMPRKPTMPEIKDAVEKANPDMSEEDLNAKAAEVQRGLGYVAKPKARVAKAVESNITPRMTEADRAAVLRKAEKAKSADEAYEKAKARISNPEIAKRYTREVHDSDEGKNVLNRLRRESMSGQKEAAQSQMATKLANQEAKSVELDRQVRDKVEEEAKKAGYTPGEVEDAISGLYGENGRASNVQRILGRIEKNRKDADIKKGRGIAASQKAYEKFKAQADKQETRAQREAERVAKIPNIMDQKAGLEEFAKREAPTTQTAAMKLIDNAVSRKLESGKLAKKTPVALSQGEINKLMDKISGNEESHLSQLAKQGDEAAAASLKTRQEAADEQARKMRESMEAFSQQNEKFEKERAFNNTMGSISDVMENAMSNVPEGDRQKFIDNYFKLHFSENNPNVAKKSLSGKTYDNYKDAAEKAAQNFADKYEESSVSDVNEELGKENPLDDILKNIPEDDRADFLQMMLEDTKKTVRRGLADSPEERANAISTIAKHETDPATREQLETLARNTRNVAQRKEVYPNNPELWLSEDERGSLSKGMTNTNYGNLAKKFLAENFGFSDTSKFTPMGRDEMIRRQKELDKGEYDELTQARKQHQVFHTGTDIGDAAKEVKDEYRDKAKEEKATAKKAAKALEAEVNKAKRKFRARSFGAGRRIGQ